MNNITNFESWTKVSKGYYRYVIGANACYEILITYDDGIIRKGTLYVTGDWKNEDRENYFGRYLIIEDEALEICLKEADVDYNQNKIGANNE